MVFGPASCLCFFCQPSELPFWKYDILKHFTIFIFSTDAIPVQLYNPLIFHHSDRPKGTKEQESRVGRTEEFIWISFSVCLPVHQKILLSSERNALDAWKIIFRYLIEMPRSYCSDIDFIRINKATEICLYGLYIPHPYGSTCTIIFWIGFLAVWIWCFNWH